MDQSDGRKQIGGDRVSPASQQLTREREVQILELRLSKIPFEKIAQIVGMTKSAVCKAYYRALNRLTVPHAKEIIIEQLEVLDRLESRLWRGFERSGLDVKNVCALIHSALRIQQRRAKLLGLDAPQQIDVSVLKPAADQNANGAGKEQQMLDRLSPEDKRVFLDLMSKMSADNVHVADTNETSSD
jgi:DNA-directed RNA polymerase specialized sigma24 family protein